jgi:hypothetical protein
MKNLQLQSLSARAKYGQKHNWRLQVVFITSTEICMLGAHPFPRTGEY